MKIIFLGTSHGVPEPHRGCSTTLIEVGGTYYFIDMGMQVAKEMVTRGLSMDAVKAVFVTHMHGDHINGLVEFADLVSWYYKDADPVIYLPMLKAEALIREWLALGGVERALRYEEVNAGVIFDDGMLKVTAIPTRHMEKSYGFLLEAEGKHVLFTGDLKHPAEDFPKMNPGTELDLAVCEGAHFSVDAYEPMLKAGKVKKICVNHYGAWSMAGIQLLEQKMGGIPVITVSDGMEFQL